MRRPLVGPALGGPPPLLDLELGGGEPGFEKRREIRSLPDGEAAVGGILRRAEWGGSIQQLRIRGGI
jgi:hypothetical protein